MTGSPFDKINKSFAPGQGAGRATYRHEREKPIIDQLRFVMQHSPTAKGLLNFADEANLEIHVMKNKANFGYMPSGRIVYISAPPEQRTPTPEMLIHLVGALREAQQETYPEMSRPNVEMGRDAFVNKFMDKKADIYFFQCCVVEEIEKALNFTEIVDSFQAMGYSDILEAYKKDKQSVSEG